MALQTQPYKGARDFYPEDKRVQKYIFGKLRSVVEKFGYEEYDAPILESLDMYLAKTGEEIVNEQVYSFEDRGGRKVAIRPEMTPTVSRMVAARRQELAYPLRWYSIPNLWRYERPQRGRLREHWQLNVDIFGVADSSAELEIISVADAIFKAFGAKRDAYTIRINSRTLVDYLLKDYLGLDGPTAEAVSKLVDKMHKMERTEFVTKLDIVCTPSQRENGIVEKLLDILGAKSLSDLPSDVHEHDSFKGLQKLLAGLQDAGVTNAEFNVTIMRGFDYYTDVVFEVYDNNPENNRSMMGGGRYDGLVGLFGVDPVPTVGFGLGDVTLQNFLEGHRLLPVISTETDLYVAAVGEVFAEAQKPVTQLRSMGLNIALGVAGKKLGDQLKTAEKKGIQYVLIIGENELKEKQYTLKNLHTGEEEKHSLERIVSLLKDKRVKQDDRD